jgi:hypothetical protein
MHATSGRVPSDEGNDDVVTLSAIVDDRDAPDSLGVPPLG